MKVYRYWARAAVPFDGSEVFCYGGSDVSEAAAQRNAEERAAAMVRFLGSGEALTYDYGTRPLREEIVKEMSPARGRPFLLTRNHYGALVLNVEDVLISAQIPWRMQTTNFSYSIYEDEFQSEDIGVIIKLLKVREHDALSDMVELNEEQMWNAPTTPDDNHLHGLPYWVVQSPLDGSGNPQVGAYAGGHSVGHPSGVAGVSSTVYPRWSNWAFGWERITSDDFVKKFKRAIRYTRFKPPVAHPSTDMGGNQYESFSTLEVVEGLEALAESRNDNLGKDVARYMNQVTVGGVPVEHVFYLTDQATNNPLYGLNWAKIKPVSKKGCYMMRHKPKVAARQHDTREVHIDNAGVNFQCVDRRSLFGGQQVAA